MFQAELSFCLSLLEHQLPFDDNPNLKNLNKFERQHSPLQTVIDTEPLISLSKKKFSTLSYYK